MPSKSKQTTSSKKQNTYHMVPDPMKKTMIVGLLSVAFILLLGMSMGWFEGMPDIPLPGLPVFLGGATQTPTAAATVAAGATGTGIVAMMGGGGGMSPVFMIALACVALALGVAIWKKGYVVKKYWQMTGSERREFENEVVKQTQKFALGVVKAGTEFVTVENITSKGAKKGRKLRNPLKGLKVPNFRRGIKP